MTLIHAKFFDQLAMLLKAAPVSNTTMREIAELIDINCPTFRKQHFLDACGYVSPKERVLKLSNKMRVVPLHRSPETEDRE